MVEIIAITRSLLNVHAFMHVFVLLYLVKVPVITGIAMLLAPGTLEMHFIHYNFTIC